MARRKSVRAEQEGDRAHEYETRVSYLQQLVGPETHFSQSKTDTICGSETNPRVVPDSFRSV
jgi:hypothetical protein